MKIFHHSKKYNIDRRIFLLIFIKIIGFFILIIRLSFLQLLKSKSYKVSSKRNHIRIIGLPASRGLIYDINGKLMLNNKYRYRVLLDKQIATDYMSSLNLLFKICNVDDLTQTIILKRVKSYGLRKPIIIINNITWDQIAIIEENSSLLSGIYVDGINSRKYFLKYYFSHVIGYIAGEKNNEFYIRGVIGAEKAFNSSLAGEYGYREIEVNARGYFVKESRVVSPVKGSDINLTIDSVLQESIYGFLHPYNGVVILRDVKNGKIYSMVSAPSFDNNIFVNSISRVSWSNLLQNKDSPLLNRSIQARYPPGSVFKIVVVLAAIELGISPDLKFLCTDTPYVNGHFRCWKKKGHGLLDMYSGIYQSCNNYIYNLATKIGPSAIIDMIIKLGLDQLSGLEDLGGELISVIPKGSEWKKSLYNDRWYLADTLNLSIGQGYLNVTPIILSNLISIIANKGVLVKPTLLNDNNIRKKDIKISEKAIEFLHKALRGTVNNSMGTAYKNRFNIGSKTMSGKSGTAQIVSKISLADDLNRTSNFFRRNHSVFLGFYPSNDPKYSITVLAEHAGAGGNVAANIAKKTFLLLG